MILYMQPIFCSIFLKWSMHIFYGTNISKNAKSMNRWKRFFFLLEKTKWTVSIMWVAIFQNLTFSVCFSQPLNISKALFLQNCQLATEEHIVKNEKGASSGHNFSGGGISTTHWFLQTCNIIFVILIDNTLKSFNFPTVFILGGQNICVY